VSELLHTKENNEARWKLQTEYIIAIAQLALSMFLFMLYFGFSSSGAVSNWQTLTKVFVAIFPIVCVARLAYVHYRVPGVIFGWLSAGIDIILLSSIIFIFSLQYETPAASLHAPSFTYYFVFIALHAMRFEVRLLIASGALASFAWITILSVFVFSGAKRTGSYAEYISSTDILVGAEVDKIIGLIAFTIVLGFGVKRASQLLSDAADKKVAEVKMHEAEKTAQLKTEFLANMSHEIRTPMNGVLGMAQVLRATKLDGEQVEFVDTIQRSGDALLTIINDVLDFSKIEAGKLRLDHAPFDMRLACEDVVTLLGVTARDKGIELALNLHPDVPINLLGDAGRLRQILTNLIGNAIKFTEKGHVLCEVNGVESDGVAQLSIHIQDTGIGIDQGQLETIFHEFAQADNSTTRRFGGTGLGLSISKNLVRLMGGELTATSKVGEGSKFSFTASFPVDRRKRERRHRPSVVDLSTTPILVVDDLDVNCDILKLQLKQMGAVPDIVRDARQAVTAIVNAHNAGHPYAVMITDYQMPDIHGLELVQTLRKREMFDSLQIIVLSSIDDPKVKHGFSDYDVSSYMTKPCRSTDLEDAIYTAATRYKTKQLVEISKSTEQKTLTRPGQEQRPKSGTID